MMDTITEIAVGQAIKNLETLFDTARKSAEVKAVSEDHSHYILGYVEQGVKDIAETLHAWLEIP